MLKIRQQIPLHKLYDHPKNPRKQLQIEDLTDSLTESGQLVPPLLVRIHGNGYQIISGHRRRAALERAGFLKAECDVVEMNDEQAYKALLVTNIQSQTLSELEEAEGIKHMMEQFEWSQQRIAVEFGKRQNWVSYRLSLLNLDESVKEQIITRVITPTHGREIAQLPKEVQSDVANKVIEQKLSTRETTELVKQYTQSAPAEINAPNNIDMETGEIIEQPAVKVSREIPANVPPVKKEEIPQLKDDVAVMERIKPGSDLILKLKTFHHEIYPHSWIIDSLIEFDKAEEAIKCIDQAKEMLEYLRLHVTNAKKRSESESSSEGKLLEFKRKEATNV